MPGSLIRNVGLGPAGTGKFGSALNATFGGNRTGDNYASVVDDYFRRIFGGGNGQTPSQQAEAAGGAVPKPVAPTSLFTDKAYGGAGTVLNRMFEGGRYNPDAFTPSNAAVSASLGASKYQPGIRAHNTLNSAYKSGAIKRGSASDFGARAAVGADAMDATANLETQARNALRGEARSALSESIGAAQGDQARQFQINQQELQRARDIYSRIISDRSMGLEERNQSFQQLMQMIDQMMRQQQMDAYSPTAPGGAMPVGRSPIGDNFGSLDEPDDDFFENSSVPKGWT